MGGIRLRFHMIGISGEHNLLKTSESSELRRKAEPPFLVHDDYEENQRLGYVVYDFTLLKLSERVNFNLYPHIRPICLPDSIFKDYQGEDVTVIGWGYTQVDYAFSGNLIKGIDSSPSNTLQKIDIRCGREESCKEKYNLGCFQIIQAE